MTEYFIGMVAGAGVMACLIALLNIFRKPAREVGQVYGDGPYQLSAKEPEKDAGHAIHVPVPKGAILLSMKSDTWETHGLGGGISGRVQLEWTSQPSAIYERQHDR